MLLEDYRNERIKKLEEIRARGIDPYPAKSFRNTKISEIINHFDERVVKGVDLWLKDQLTDDFAVEDLTLYDLTAYDGCSQFEGLCKMDAWLRDPETSRMIRWEEMIK